MKNKIKTSVIGSYPIPINPMELMNCYFKGLEISWEIYIKRAVNDMINAGLDIISDGQIRDPFIQLFTRKLKGCRIRSRTEIVNKVKYNRPITVKDQSYIRDYIPKNTELLGILTGPYTLSKSCVDFYYNSEKELSFDFAYALSKEAKILQKYVNIISIDEPFFSNYMPEYGKELIGIITKNISCPTRLHVCGDVSKIIPELIDIPIDILSHEFKALPQILDSYKEYNCSKKICLGSVRSDNLRIESVEEILQHIKNALHIFGERITQIAPDCGQLLLSRDVAFKKLKNLVLAGEKLND
jgi:5-methyltetrahydropteroyltriglutamate--homocysteine methyltransferase